MSVRPPTRLWQGHTLFTFFKLPAVVRYYNLVRCVHVCYCALKKAMSDSLADRIKQEVIHSPAIALMGDEVSDILNHEMLVLFVKYLKYVSATHELQMPIAS